MLFVVIRSFSQRADAKLGRAFAGGELKLARPQQLFERCWATLSYPDPRPLRKVPQHAWHAAGNRDPLSGACAGASVRASDSVELGAVGCGVVVWGVLRFCSNSGEPSLEEAVSSKCDGACGAPAVRLTCRGHNAWPNQIGPAVVEHACGVWARPLRGAGIAACRRLAPWGLPGSIRLAGRSSRRLRCLMQRSATMGMNPQLRKPRV